MSGGCLYCGLLPKLVMLVVLVVPKNGGGVRIGGGAFGD